MQQPYSRMSVRPLDENEILLTIILLMEAHLLFPYFIHGLLKIVLQIFNWIIYRQHDKNVNLTYFLKNHVTYNLQKSLEQHFHHGLKLQTYCKYIT